jgi:hypothetical protein
MSKCDLGALMLAIAAATAMHSAAASTPAKPVENCRPAGTAAAPERGIQSACREDMFRASYVAPRAAAEPRGETAQRLPEPGHWSKLLAALLGAISMVFRRMS